MVLLSSFLRSAFATSCRMLLESHPATKNYTQILDTTRFQFARSFRAMKSAKNKLYNFFKVDMMDGNREDAVQQGRLEENSRLTRSFLVQSHSSHFFVFGPAKQFRRRIPEPLPLPYILFKARTLIHGPIRSLIGSN